MGSKISIIEGNSNDKDNVRTYMVKGEKGDAGVSPTIETSKVSGTATITITDAEGTHTFTLSDGEMTKAMVIDSLTSDLTDQPLSAKQGKVLKGLVDAIPIVDVQEVSGTWNGGSDFKIDLPTGYSPTNCTVLGIYMGANHTMRYTDASNYIWQPARWYFMSNNTQLGVDVESLNGGTPSSGYTRNVSAIFLKYSN